MPLWYKIWFFTVLFGAIYSVVKLFASPLTATDYFIRAYVGVSLVIDLIAFPVSKKSKGSAL